MAKKALIILSSPRKNSNSDALALAMGEGFKDAGGLVETVNMTGLEIGPCLACEACQKNGGQCVRKDDMQNIYPQVVAADVLIMASPIYWFNISAQLKIFIDRCFAVAMSGEGPFSQKTIAASFTYGDVDPFVSGCVNAIRSFQDICSYTGAKWGGCVYGTALEAGKIQKNDNLLEEAKKLGASLI